MKVIALYTLIYIIMAYTINMMGGNPIKDFMLKFCSDETTGYVTGLEEYYKDSNRGEILMHSYNFNYKINARTYNQYVEEQGGVDKNVRSDISETDPEEVIVQYVYFLPGICQIKGSGYPNIFEYIIFSLILKSAIYLGGLLFYLNKTKDEYRILFERIFYGKKEFEKSGINIKYHLISILIDLLLIYSLISSFYFPVSLTSGTFRIVLGYLFMFLSLPIVYIITKRIVDQNIAGWMYGLSIFFVLCIEPITQYLTKEFGGLPVMRAFSLAILFVIIKGLIEIILFRVPGEIEYPIIKWVKEKLEH